jgi:hypothetical protein
MVYRTRQKNPRRFRATRKNQKPADGVLAGLIFANWCGHCQALKPVWNEVKQSLLKNPQFKNLAGKIIEIEDSDSQKDGKIANINKNIKGEPLKVNGFPTIFKKRGGSIEYYNGERTTGGLEKWFLGGNPNMPTTGGYKLKPRKQSKQSNQSKTK